MTRRGLGGLVAGLLLACGGASPGGRVDGLVGTRARMLEDGGLVAAGEHIDDALLLAILADPRVPDLRDVELADNAITVVGVQALLDHAKTAGLRALHLGSNPLGDAGLVALAGSSRLANVERLLLGNVGATSAGVAALAGTRNASALTMVELGYQAVGDHGAVALVGLPAGTLLLQKAGIGGVGARALLAGAAATSLTLDENPIGAGGLVGLTALAPTLMSLSLKQTALGPADAAALAALPAPALRHLSLAYADLGDDGVHAIAGAPWLGQLKSLDLTGTRASAAAYAALRAAWGERGGLSAG
ncbi:MAG: hypothetical protein Q8P41_09860 [Pseudomonadota bacterium]|nr:hypothetical protein [Pseudomonadota bacterium]